MVYVDYCKVNSYKYYNIRALASNNHALVKLFYVFKTITMVELVTIEI